MEYQIRQYQYAQATKEANRMYRDGYEVEHISAIAAGGKVLIAFRKMKKAGRPAEKAAKKAAKKAKK